MSSNQKQEEREDLILLADALNFPHLKNAKDNLQPDFSLPMPTVFSGSSTLCVRRRP